MRNLIACRKNWIQFLLGIFTLTSCSGEPEIDPKALDYVYKANRTMVSPGRRELIHTKALAYLDSAIATDKRCKVAYWNKYNILNGLKRYRDALPVIDQLLTLNPDAPDVIVTKAILLKKLEDPSADAYFEKALYFYNQRQEKEMTDQDMLGKSYCLYFLDGREAGLNQIMVLKKRLPKDKHVDYLISRLAGMTKSQFLESL